MTDDTIKANALKHIANLKEVEDTLDVLEKWLREEEIQSTLLGEEERSTDLCTILNQYSNIIKPKLRAQILAEFADDENLTKKITDALECRYSSVICTRQIHEEEAMLVLKIVKAHISRSAEHEHFQLKKEKGNTPKTEGRK